MHLELHIISPAASRGEAEAAELAKVHLRGGGVALDHTVHQLEEHLPGCRFQDGLVQQQ